MKFTIVHYDSSEAFRRMFPEYRWYVQADGGFLHNDLNIHAWCKGQKTSGWYKTRREAREVVKLYKSKQRA